MRLEKLKTGKKLYRPALNLLLHALVFAVFFQIFSYTTYEDKQKNTRLLMDIIQPVAMEALDTTEFKNLQRILESLTIAPDVIGISITNHDGKTVAAAQANAGAKPVTGFTKQGGQNNRIVAPINNGSQTLGHINLELSHRSGEWLSGASVITPIGFGLLGVLLVFLASQALAKINNHRKPPSGKLSYEQEKLMNSLIDSAPFLISYIDNNLIYRFSNKTHATWHNEEPDKVVGKSVQEVLTPESFERLAPYLEKAFSGEKQTFQTSFQSKDGVNRFVRLIYTPSFGEKGWVEGVCAIAEDITKEKEAELAMFETENRLRLILNHIPLPVSVSHPETAEYLLTNRAANEFYLGQPFGMEGMDGHGIWVDVSDRKSLMENLDAAETTYTYETRFYDHTKTPRWVIASTAKINFEGKTALLTSFLDITERKEAQERLQENESLLQAVFDAMPLWISVKGRDLRYLMVNRQALLDTGLSKEDYIGVHTHDLPIGDRLEMKRNAQYDSEVLATGNPVERKGLTQKLKDGSEIFLDHLKFPYLDAAGEIAGIVTVSIDITERLNVQNELQRLNENLEERVNERTKALENAQGQLIQREKLATLGRLTATVSHELRNPLGSIKMSLFTIMHRLNPAQLKLEGPFKRIERNVERSEKIIDELLTFSKTRPPNLEETPIDTWIKDLVEEQDVPPNIMVETAWNSGDYLLPIDMDFLRRAVINVFENAVHALNGGPDKPNCQSILSLKTELTESRMNIVFQDNGPGIAPEVQKKIFEPLYSTKNFGTGLGLPIVTQLMGQMGGGINLESEAGEGTTVTLWLPLKPMLDPETSSDSEEVGHTPSGRRSTL